MRRQRKVRDESRRQSPRQRERDRQDLGARPAMRAQRAREPIAAERTIICSWFAGGHDRDDRDALAQRQLDESLAATEHDLVAILERPERVEIRARIDEHAGTGRKRMMRALVTRAQKPEPPRVVRQQRIVEQEVVREPVDRAIALQSGRRSRAP